MNRQADSDRNDFHGLPIGPNNMQSELAGLTDADFAAFGQREADVADALESAVEVDAVAVSTHARRMALVVV